MISFRGVMRVLLVVSKFGYPEKAPRPELFPQGVAYVAGALKAAGHEVFGCNISYALTKTSAFELLRQSLARGIAECQPQAIALGGLSADYLFIAHTIDLCRQLAPQVPLILGGGIVTGDRNFITEHLRPDFSITGDAEFPMVELLAALRNGFDPNGIPGLAHWRDGAPVYNAPPAETRVMPEYARPDYDALGIEDFFLASSHRHASSLSALHPRPRAFPVTAGRSCPFKCTFCFHSAGSVYKQRPIADVLDEIAYFHERYHFNLLMVYDELFSVTEGRVRQFCDGMRALNLGVAWSCAMRVPDADEDLMRDMRDAGCRMIGFGVESGSDVVLTSMRKKITQAQVRAALAAADRAGIGFQANVIYGDPAETAETIRETSDFCGEFAGRVIYPGIIVPFPGAPIFDDAVRRGLIPDRARYYEGLHGAPVYNLTALPDSEFRSLVGDAMMAHISHLRFGAIAPVVFLVVGRGTSRDQFPRTTLVLRVTCPHCGALLDRILDFGGDIRDVMNGDDTQLAAFIGQGIEIPCPDCYKLLALRMDLAATELVPVVTGGELLSYPRLLANHKKE